MNEPNFATSDPVVLVRFSSFDTILFIAIVRRVERLTSAAQMHQYLRVELCWWAMSPIWICRLLGIICYLGELKIATLVDTGSDYDAIDKDLSELQEVRKNVAFRGRTSGRRVNVSGFATTMSHGTDAFYEWIVTLRGSEVGCGPRVTKEIPITLQAFADLGDPVVLGLPFVDQHGGIETTLIYVYMADLYINRLHTKHDKKQSVSSTSTANAP